MEKTDATIRVTVDLPQTLEQKITELSKEERRSRQAQIVVQRRKTFAASADRLSARKIIRERDRETGKKIIVDFESQVISLDLLDELESSYLEVVLIPAPERKHAEHYIRAVQSQNAQWYRKFCEEYVSNRKGSKLRTRIKRRATIKALEKLANGINDSIYTERLLEFIRNNYKEKKTMGNEKYCVRCMEDFPVEDIKVWQMGAMRTLERAPKRIREKFQDVSDEQMYLCRNCYFDLTDDDF